MRHEATDHVRHERQVSNRHELTCEKGGNSECRTCRFDASLTWRTSFFRWLHGPDVSNFRPYVSQVSRLSSKHASCEDKTRGIPRSAHSGPKTVHVAMLAGDGARLGACDHFLEGMTRQLKARASQCGTGIAARAREADKLERLPSSFAMLAPISG